MNCLPLLQQRLNPHQWYLRTWICSMVCPQILLFLVSLIVHIGKQSNYNVFMVTKPPNLSRTWEYNPSINNSFPECNLEDHVRFQKEAWKPTRDYNSYHFYKFDIQYFYRFYFSGCCSKGNILLLYAVIYFWALHWHYTLMFHGFYSTYIVFTLKIDDIPW